jgi:ubiquinone/menaquinone biosynthesis C-methylase UbiE
MTADVDYMLGNSETEHQRLMLQGRFLRPWTERFLRSAGLAAGASVLDLGCGVGDVSLLAAEIVGPRGRVLGVDLDPVSLARARHRVSVEGCGDVVDFSRSSLDEFTSEGRFDAVVGRLILLYQKDPAETIRRYAQFVKPGGLLLFHEMNVTVAQPTWPACAVWDDLSGWVAEGLENGGAMPDVGRRLGAMFRAAGLPWPTIEAHETTAGDRAAYLYDWLAQTLITAEARLRAMGKKLPPGWEFDETLARNLEDAVLAAGSQVRGPVQVGAWSRRVE